MFKFLSRSGRLIIAVLLLASVVSYFSAPKTYDLFFCIECFSIFLFSAILLLVNNIRQYRTWILFEVLFTLSFFFVNYAYPVFIYSSGTPYFSLFLYGFNEDIISKATALATVGYCGYALFQYSESGFVVGGKQTIKHSRVSSFEVILLFILLVIYVYQALPALRGGYSYSGGAGFFRILAIFLCFKRFYNHDMKHPRQRDIALWTIIAIYVVINLMVGNRGDPLYVVMAIFLSYSLFVRVIPTRIFIASVVIGLSIFFVVGQVRNTTGDLTNSGSMIERVREVQRDDYGGGVLMYGKELIINNRSLYVLLDYATREGLDYGQSWQMNLYSVIPFLQSTMVQLFDISPEFSASVNLTTYLEFGSDDPNAFGLGTNLIGDIFICFGLFGVIVFMALLGYLVKQSCSKSKVSTGYALLYVCFFVFSVYYPRATYLEPIRLVAWSWVMYMITFKKTVKANII